MLVGALSSGGGVDLSDVGTAMSNISNSGNTSFTAEVGKAYFVRYSRGTSSVGIDYGGTELGKVVINSGGTYYYVGLVEATATTVKVLGSGVAILYSNAIE